MDIRFDEKIVSTIVHAINQAVTVGIPMARDDNKRFTTNCYASLGVDVIYEYLHNMVIFDNVLIHQFKRHNWRVVMIIDYNAHNIYFVLSKRNLKSIAKKQDRTWPHYLQSLLHEFHKGYEGRYVQQSLFPSQSFPDAVFKKDVNMILGNLIDPLDNWHIYTIAHEYRNNELIDIRQYFLSPQFDIIDEKDLTQYIIPDYSSIITPVAVHNNAEAEIEEDDELFKLKPHSYPVSETDADPQVKPNKFNDVG